MLLGLSGAASERDTDLQVVAGPGDGGVAAGALLTNFAEQVHHRSVDDAGRKAIIESVGTDGLVDAAAVCANFNMMVRIADGTGTPLDTGSVSMSERLRAELDLDKLASRRLASATGGGEERHRAGPPSGASPRSPEP